MSDVRVLLAEDHEVVRAGLRALVDAAPGLRVVAEAKDGDEAARRARAVEPDVVVMDISMPVMSGITATERIAAECPNVRVLALTAHDDRAHLAQALAAGAAGYLLKRAAPHELVRAIRAVASGETYIDPLLAGTMLRNVAGTTTVDDAGASHDPLSAREEEVLRRLAWGESNKEIAAHLDISVKTVETYRSRIANKLGLRSRTELVRYALQRGWLAGS